MFDPNLNFEELRRLIAYATIFQPLCARCTTERNEAMKDKDRISERALLESMQKYAFRTQLWQLRSLETATKKRRAQKRRRQAILVCEINEDFGLITRPGLRAAFWFLALSRVRRGIIEGEIPLYALGGLFVSDQLVRER
jgi:hypothetical protein